MLVHQLAQGLGLLGLLCQGIHLDGQLAVQEQLRVGDSYIPGVQGSNTLSLSEIIAPSVQGHMTALKADQDLLVRYQPRFLETLQIVPGGGGHRWTGWSQMHRVLVQYQAGEERTVKMRSSVNLAAGKLDISEPDALVQDSGFLPGRLGTLVNYTNLNGMLSLTHKTKRYLRLSSAQTLGMIQYPARQGLSYFGAMANASQMGTLGNQTQYRINSRNEAELILDRRHSLFADGEVLDVSYQQTASYPGFMITGGYGHTPSTYSQLRVDGGVMKYWVNPAPGIIKKPQYLPTVSATFNHTFVSWGMPHLTAHMVATLKPFFNLQFSSLEPRTTLQLQLSYAATRRLSVMGSARLLSSMVGSFTHWEKLPGGHPKNVVLLNVGVHYNWREMLIFDCNAYGSEQQYVTSATSPFGGMRQLYIMLGVRGTWQSRVRGSHG